MLLSNVCDFFLWNRLTHSIMRKNKMMMTKTAPPTDPAIIGTDDLMLESLSGKVPV